MRKSIRKHRAALARTSAAVATGVALLALALPGPSANGQASPGWSTYGYDVRRTGFNPTETRLLPATVGGLHRLWRVNLGGVSITSPIVARGLMVRGAARTVIYVGTEHGNLVAVNASGRVEWNRSLGSATTTCPNTPDDVFGIGGTPVLDPVAGRLYVAVNDGASGHVFVYALDAATGKTVTGWPVSIDNDPLHMHVWGALTLWQGTLYVTTGGMCDIPPYWGRVIAIHTATPSIAASWSVVHVGDEVKQGGGIWGYGGAAVESRTGDVFVATGNALGPQPQDQPYAESVVRLDGTNLSVRAANAPKERSGPDLDFGATPLVFKTPGCPSQVVAMNKDGLMFVYLEDSIETGPVQRIPMAKNLMEVGRFMGIPAYSPVTHLVYVTNAGPERTPYVHGMVAFRENGSCHLVMAWQKRAGLEGNSVSTPTVAGGVVYYGDGKGQKVIAFDAGTGRRLWTSGQALVGRAYAAPVVVNGRLYAATWGSTGGQLVAFGLGGG